MLAAVALALACAIGALGCSGYSAEEQLVRSERAAEAWAALASEVPGTVDLVTAFGITEELDEWGNALPVLELDGAKTKLIVDLVDVYNATADEAQRLSMTDALEVFEHLPDVLAEPEGAGYAFLVWAVSPSSADSSQSNVAAIAAV